MLCGGPCCPPPPPPPPPKRLPIKAFRLFSSLPSSRSLFSEPSLWPSSAFGIPSLSPRISSLSLRVSSSLLRVAALSSVTTASTSSSALSNLSVLASSADFSVAVSFDKVSRRAKARVNCSSIAALSDSSCGGVGGEIRGAM